VRKENVSLNVKETHTHRTCFETKEQARRHTEKVRQSNSAKTTSSVNRDVLCNHLFLPFQTMRVRQFRLGIFFRVHIVSWLLRRYFLMTVPRTEVFSSLAPECVIFAPSASSISKANRVSSASEIRFYFLSRRLFHSHLRALLPTSGPSLSLSLSLSLFLRQKTR